MENLWNQTQTQKVLILSEAMEHRMRMFDTVFERPEVIFLALERYRTISVIFGQHNVACIVN